MDIPRSDTKRMYIFRRFPQLARIKAFWIFLAPGSCWILTGPQLQAPAPSGSLPREKLVYLQQIGYPIPDGQRVKDGQ